MEEAILDILLFVVELCTDGNAYHVVKRYRVGMDIPACDWCRDEAWLWGGDGSQILDVDQRDDVWVQCDSE